MLINFYTIQRITFYSNNYVRYKINVFIQTPKFYAIKYLPTNKFDKGTAIFLSGIALL